ncbi:MAG: hypothetical protein FWC86_00825 [Coriobacteriia bacterium]|nr:hypothetical protein [Coriobacteriia bacterium]
MKHVVVILDGAADNKLSQLNDFTPFEISNSPNLDRMAGEGICGLAQTIPEGMDVLTDVACMSILGYNPAIHYPSRETIEAAANRLQSAKVGSDSSPGNCSADMNNPWPFLPGEVSPDLIPIEKALSLRTCMSSGVTLMQGFAALLGIDFLDIEGITDDLDNDFAAQADAAIESMLSDEFDLAIIHVDAPDKMSHQGNAADKIEAIELIDTEVISRLLDSSQRLSKKSGGPGLRILAMPDHYTSVETHRHEEGAVPFVIWGDSITSNGAKAFSEAECAQTGLSLIPNGHEIMSLLLKK